MSLNTGPTEDSIITQLKTVISRVYGTEVPSDIVVVYPFIVVYFGTPIRSGLDHHITSVRNDTQIGYLTVQTISTTDISARDINNKVRDKLVGFIPTDGSEMVPEGGISYSKVNSLAQPTKYYRESAFSYRTNLSWN